MNSPTFQAAIIKALAAFGEKGSETEIPSTTNTDSHFGRAFMWDVIQSYAKKQSDAEWEKLEREGILDKCPDEKGDYKLGEGKRFVALASVSDPVKRFNEAYLIDLLYKKHKIARPTGKELIGDAKRPTKPLKRLTIVER